MEVNADPDLLGYKHCLKYLTSVFGRTKKGIQVQNNFLSKNFSVNYPFKLFFMLHGQFYVCVCARSGSRCIHTGRRHQRLMEGVSEAWC